MIKIGQGNGISKIGKPWPREGMSCDPVLLWLFVVFFVLWFAVLPSVHRAGFFDGLIYSSIARNMAEDYGSPLRPYFSETLFSSFAEHPPLMMIAESFLFRMWGNNIYIEKVFGIVLLLLTLLCFTGLWRRMAGDDIALARFAPVPLILSLLCGEYDHGFGWGFAWIFVNNMLEAGLLPPVCLAIWSCLSIVDERRTVRRLLWLSLGAASLTVAVFIKGPVGLFPLSTIALHWLVFRKTSFFAAVRDSLLLLLMTAGFIGLGLLSTEARDYAWLYLDKQVFASLTGDRGDSGGGYKALKLLLQFLYYPFLICASAMVLDAVLLRRGQTQRSSFWNGIPIRHAVFFLLIALSASAPIFLSKRISAFYFNPAFPFFVASMASLAYPSFIRILHLVERLSLPAARLTALAAIALMFNNILNAAGHEGRDQRLMASADAVAEAICKSGTPCRLVVASCGEVGLDWQLHAYLQRHHRISMGVGGGVTPTDTSSLFILASNGCQWRPDNGYQMLELPQNEYRLWMRSKM